MSDRGSLDIWGGIECTLARLRDRVRDQVVETGHRDRPDDLERIAALGIRTLRYPVLWETATPRLSDQPDHAWHDERLTRIRALGLTPVAGLVHHGSGPVGTDLLDADFPHQLARYAASVAVRYPWIDAYTPVNEPLTTARFSCLYGHWHPHAASQDDFLRALVNQCRATVLSMRAIRAVNRGAKLVQTEDLGRVFSTPALSYQAEYENERRWLSFDLLFGRVDRHHPWWRRLRDSGISEGDLGDLLDGDVTPDIVGVNHYLTSERFLDERTDRYPPHLVGGNGRARYADVEAVRIPLGPGSLGPAARLREIWLRYRAPVAVTETHHGSSRDEQLRWLHETWCAAREVRQEGADIRAVTAWSLFGTVDWNSLLTRDLGIYEPGAFDVRGPAPRATALARATRDLARTGSFDHPVLDVPGWWRRPGRLHEPGGAGADDRDREAYSGARALLVAGPEGALRRALVRVAAGRGLACRILADSSSAQTQSLVDASSIWGVLDLVDGDGDPTLPDERLSALVAWCRAAGAPYVQVSSQPVHGVSTEHAVVETDAARPDTQAGQRILEGQMRLLETCPSALVLRTGPIFGPWEADTVVMPLVAALAAADPVPADTRLVSLTYLPDLWHVALDLVIDGETGIRHLAGAAVAWDDLVRMTAGRVGHEARTSQTDRLPPAHLPAALATCRGDLMPPLSSALERFVRDSPTNGHHLAPVFQAAAE